MEDAAKRSAELTREGVELKRQGKFREAARKYIEAIKVYPDDPEQNMVFYSLGKALYLNGEYKRSVSAYLCYFCESITSEMVADYKKLATGRSLEERVGLIASGISEHRETSPAHGRLVGFFANISAHLGHSLLDEGHDAQEECISLYRQAMLGKMVSTDWRSSDYQKSCVRQGTRLLYQALDDFIQNADAFMKTAGAWYRKAITEPAIKVEERPKADVPPAAAPSEVKEVPPHLENKPNPVSEKVETVAVDKASGNNKTLKTVLITAVVMLGLFFAYTQISDRQTAEKAQPATSSSVSSKKQEPASSKPAPPPKKEEKKEKAPYKPYDQLPVK